MLTCNESCVYELSVLLGSGSVRSSPFTFTTIDDLITSLEHNGLKLYPNPGPASGSSPLTIEFYARKQDNASLRIFDMQGKLLYQETPSLQSGKNTVQLSLDAFPPGSYLLSLRLKAKLIERPFRSEVRSGGKECVRKG